MKHLSTRTATRASLIALALVASAQTKVSTSHAQTFVRRAVIAGNNVSGLELAIEGPMHGIRGGTIRWQLAAQQVTGLSELHVSPRTRIRVLCSLVRERAMAEVTTDELGRAEAGFVIPEDAPEQFHVVFEAISPNNIRRQFDLDVHTESSRAISLHTDRAVFSPGSIVHGWGQLTSTITGRALANETVTMTLFDSATRPVATRWTGQTDANGTFRHSFTLPANLPGNYSLSVMHYSEHESVTVGRSLRSLVSSAPSMVVRAMPAQSMVEPRQRVRVLVSVRTADGQPVDNAIVHSSRIERTALTPRNEAPFVRTGPDGIASFEFVPPSGGALVDQPIDVQASRVGLGDANTRTSVRVATNTLYAAASVEGGSLTQGLSGKVYARVVRANGAPAGAGVTVSITGPRLGRAVQATTDADGVAVLDVTLGNAPVTRPRPARRVNAAPDTEDQESESSEDDTALDACGGTTSTAFSLALAEGPVHGTATGCLGIEPDATVRPRVREGTIASPDTDLHVTLARLPSIARVPIHLALIARDSTNYAPIAGAIVAAGANEGTIHIPASAHGMLIVRARPLWGSLAQPILGGSTAVWVHRGQRVALKITEASESMLQLDVGTATGLPVALTVVPQADSQSLLAQLGETDSSRVLGDLRTPFAQASSPLIAGAMFARMIRDNSVQGVLRGTRVVDLPAPETPADWGNLRDPYRSAARFVEGRLALIFQSIERHVASKIRTHRADVGQRVGARWEFNREIFDALMQSEDGADSSGGARNLGGGPLTIQDLQRLDPAFTFDNVARRLTRQRMFVLLVALRQFAAQRALDLRWSWRGDPTAWLRQMASSDGEFSIEDSDGNSTSINADSMVDGWGNPFALRPAPGGRSRFGFLSPVPGFDLVSAGPDERMGTADDIVDPFARVLPSSGAYARAMNEDGLVARLHGVELGRATIARLLGVFEASSSYESGEEEGASESSPSGPDWNALPTKLLTDPFALSLLRPSSTATTFAAQIAGASNATPVRIALDDEPRVWVAIAHAVDAAGTSVFNTRTFSAGKPVLITLPIAPRVDELRPTLPRIRVGEALNVLAHVTNLSDTDRSFAITVRSEGSVSAQAPATLSVPAGQSATVPLLLNASTAGLGAVTLELRDGSQAVLRRVRAPLLADYGGLSLRQDAMSLMHGSPIVIHESLPNAMRGPTERLVLLAPNAVADDPELDRVRRTDPALIAWSYTMAGRQIPQALADSLLQALQPSGEVIGDLRGRSNNSAPALSAACAMIAWAAADEDDRAAQQALYRVRQRFSAFQGSGFYDTEPNAGQIRLLSATLAALATGAPTMSASEGHDPVGAFVEAARARLHGVRDSFSSQPTILARAAAALLLTDPADNRGRTMYERAKRAVVDSGAHGALVGAGEGRARMEEVLAASAALAIAAQQRGDLALARSLALGVALRGHLAMRAGGEVAFWLLADSAFGVLGLDNPTTATVVIDGASQQVTLRDGRALIDVRSSANSQRNITISTPQHAPLLARWELTYAAAGVVRADAPVTLAIAGDPGFAGERAALELTVQNTQNFQLNRVVVELQVPAGTGLGEELVQAMRSSANLSSAELRDGGLLHMVIGAIAANQTSTIALPFRWLSQGTVSGLGTVAYLEDRPTRMTVLAPREIVLRDRPAGTVTSPERGGHSVR
jgi:hypothetical protein